MGIRRTVYLDNNATTQLDKRVQKAMKSALNSYGNPSSLYALGKSVRYFVEKSRQYVSELINAHPEEIVFTSGGTEGNNTILKGVSNRSKNKGRHIITSQIEHPSVIDTCQYLEKNGFKVTYLPVDSHGLINVNNLKQAITKETILISIMTANNEIGSIQDIKNIATFAREREILFHTDAVQAVGKIPVDVSDTGVDFLTFSAHKIYGPKGIGALYIKDSNRFENLIHGGHQENLLRGGTENTPGIIGFGEAARIMKEEGAVYNKKIKQLREEFSIRIKKIFPAVKINGPVDNPLPNTINLLFPEVDNKKVIALLDYYGICASTGSACSEGGNEQSHVLKALGLSDREASFSIRLSLGKYNSKKDMRYCLRCLKDILLKDKTELEYIAPLALDESILFNPDYFLIDLRYNVQRRLTKIMPNAHLVDRTKLDEDCKKIPRDKNIILICEYGAAAISYGYRLKKKGFSRIILLIGGHLAWMAAHPGLYKKYALSKDHYEVAE
ncbi:MAG: IscS subfamily cysteine desulfurase [bacterium]